MKNLRHHLQTLTTCAALLHAGHCFAESDQLHVMLQGSTSEQMRELVEQHRGQLTHDLPIISAVGALLTRPQLDAILATEKVDRYIDDLRVDTRDEDEQETPECDVGGALQLEFEANSFVWRLYNKRDSAAQVEKVTMSWPEDWGAVKQFSIGDTDIPAGLLGKKPGELTFSLGGKTRATIAGMQTLQVSFEHPSNESPAARQSAINAEIAFAGDCSAEIMPAYEDNANDYYYSTVSEADKLHRHGIRGQDVTVAVLDSGLWEHPALAKNSTGKDRVLARYDAISNKAVSEALDESGHGTHLTSVLAHNAPTLLNGQPTGSYRGIAPDINLVAVKAFNVEGQGGMLDIVRGVQWVVENREKYDIRVLNLSFASRPRWPYWLDPVNQAVMRAWAEGIVVIAAAGNEGPEPMSVGSPGNLPYIITVGAVTDSWTPFDRSDDYIPDFSSRGPTPAAHIKPDIVAPGGHMTGLTRPGSTLTTENPEYGLHSGEFVMTGSSQAAALVSGLSALLLQLEPTLSPDAVKCMLTSSADPAINADGLLAYSPFQQGHGYVSITRAITLGDKQCGNEELDLKKELEEEQHFEGPAIVDEDGIVSLPGLETLISAETPAKGKSDTRVWGVKEHVERLPEDHRSPDGAPFDWSGQYRAEKQRIEALSSGT